MSVDVDEEPNTLDALRRRGLTAAVATCLAALILNLALAASSGALTARTAAAPRHPLPQIATDQAVLDPYRRRPVVATVLLPRPAPGPHIALVASADGISAIALTAYERAAQHEQRLNSSCRIPWQLVAAIGYIESDDGQFGGDHLRDSGQEATPLLGIPLDGSPGVALILDMNGHYARAEGPMQFIPSTWASWHTDGNGDHRADPQNIFDATDAAAAYLCSGSGDLASQANQPAAIAHYNDSPIYVKNVMNVEDAYLAGLPASTVTLIPMPTTPTCPKGKRPRGPKRTAAARRAGEPKICIPAKHKRAVAGVRRIDLLKPRTPVPATSPPPSPKPSSTPAPTPASPGPSPQPSVSPTPSSGTSSSPPTPTASP